MTVAALIESIYAAADSAPGGMSEEERCALLKASEHLMGRLESVREKSQRILFAPHQSIALRLAVDMGLFDMAAELSSGGKEIDVHQLAAKTNADPLFVLRVMRFLVGMAIFQQTGPQTFSSTPCAASYVSASPLAQAIIHMTQQNEVISAFPSFFAETGYQSPTDAYHGPFQHARKVDQHYFDWLAQQPRYQHAFNVVMGLTRTPSGQRWFDLFPMSEVPAVSQPSDAFLVDVGGGIGYDLVALKQKHPDLAGRLILEELAVVVESLDGAQPDFEAISHDFFAEQPIKAARAYFLGNVLHDWPDKQALQILERIKDAMDQRSQLLVYENMLPETNVPLQAASGDFTMMANFSGLERTEVQFRSLLEMAGLKLVKVWAPGDDMKGNLRRLLQAVLSQ